MDNELKDQRVRLIELYFSNGSSAAAAIREYRNRFGVINVCSAQALRDLVQKFRATGSVMNVKPSGRPPMADDLVAEVHHAAEEEANENHYGEASTSKIANRTGIPKATVWRAMRKKLNMKPYRIQTLHELKVADPPRRLEFAHRFLADNTADVDWKYRILWSDEANFTLCGQVNTWNTRIWQEQNPHAFLQEPLHSPKVTVWVGFTAEFILGPYFFQEFDANGEFRSVTVNGVRYREMLAEFVIPTLDEMGELDQTVFMQDGAPAHVTRPVMDLLNAEFDERLISRNSDYPWPARSPDLTPMDFWLWPVLKDKVYKRPQRNMAELRHSIAEAVRSITRAERIAAIDGVITRLNLADQQQGEHIEHLL